MLLFFIPFTNTVIPLKSSLLLCSNIFLIISTYDLSANLYITIPKIIHVMQTKLNFKIIFILSCIYLFIKKSPYNTLCYMAILYANFSLSLTASLSHLLFSSSVECPLTLRNFTSCISICLSSLSHKSTFFTSFLSAFLHPFFFHE